MKYSAGGMEMREWGGEIKKGEKRKDNAPLEAWGKEVRREEESRTQAHTPCLGHPARR